MIQILTIESQPFAENSYLVWREGGSEAFVIDLDGVAFPLVLTTARRWRDLSRLGVGEGCWYEIGPAGRRRFLSAYLDAAGLSDPRAAWHDLSSATTFRAQRRAARRAA